MNIHEEHSHKVEGCVIRFQFGQKCDPVEGGEKISKWFCEKFAFGETEVLMNDGSCTFDFSADDVKGTTPVQVSGKIPYAFLDLFSGVGEKEKFAGGGLLALTSPKYGILEDFTFLGKPAQIELEPSTQEPSDDEDIPGLRSMKYIEVELFGSPKNSKKPSQRAKRLMTTTQQIETETTSNTKEL